MKYLYFAVDYEEKDDAKSLGMRWHTARKSWYTTGDNPDLGYIKTAWGEPHTTQLFVPRVDSEFPLLDKDMTGKPFAVSRYMRIPSLDALIERLDDDLLEKWASHEFYGPSVRLEIEHRAKVG